MYLLNVLTNVTNKTQISYRIRIDQLDFMKENNIERSSWIRRRLQEAMAGKKDFPTGDHRRQNQNLKATSSLVTFSQKEFAREVDMNVSQYIDNEIDALMDQYSG